MADVWAINPDNLGSILAVVQSPAPEALSTQQGRPLENTRKVSMRGSTAIIPVVGPIFRRKGYFAGLLGATTLESLALDFKIALDDPAVEQIVLEISSPGGQVAGVSEFADMVHASTKPVIAYVGDTAASAAYWIASAANEIVISDTALVGSIGVVTTWRRSRDSEITIISNQSPLKQANPETDAGRAELQTVVNDLAAIFISAVARYRGVSVDTVLSDFGRGGVMVGEKAVSTGLADRIGSFESLLSGSGRTAAPTSPSPRAHHPQVLSQSKQENIPMNMDQLEKEILAGGLDALAVEQRVAAEWPKNQDMREEFGELAVATSYFQAVATGQARRIGMHGGQ